MNQKGRGEITIKKTSFNVWYKKKFSIFGEHIPQEMYFFAWYIYCRIREDKDFFIIVDGDEGSGKSSWAVCLAVLVDDEFCIENVSFTSLTFIERLLTVSNLSSVIFDESGELSNRRPTSSINVNFLHPDL